MINDAYMYKNITIIKKYNFEENKMNYKELLGNNNFIIDGDLEKVNIKDYFFGDTNVYNLGEEDLINKLEYLYNKYLDNGERITIIINSLSAIYKSKDKEEIYSLIEKLLIESKIRFVIFDSNVISLPRKIRKHFDLIVYDKSYASRMCNVQLTATDITGITYNGSFYRVKEDYSLDEIKLEKSNEIIEREECNDISEDKNLILAIYEFSLKNNSISISNISDQFEIGFNRSKRIVEVFESLGLVVKNNNQTTFVKSVAEAKIIVFSM